MTPRAAVPVGDATATIVSSTTRLMRRIVSLDFCETTDVAQTLRTAPMPNLDGIHVQSLVDAGLIAGGHWCDEVESTNTCLLNDTQFQAHDGVYLLGADRQTAGRGRNAKRWSTKGGALTFSLLLPGDRVPKLLSLRAAVAVCDAVDRWIAERSQVKWPNDVMVDDRKLCGILIEQSPTAGTVIGVGLNVNNRAKAAATDIRSTMTSVSDLTGSDVSRSEVLRGFLEQWHVAVGKSCDEVVASIAGRNWLVGRDVAVVDGPLEQERMRGRVCSIDESGGLVLQTLSNRTVVHSGSIQILPG